MICTLDLGNLWAGVIQHHEWNILVIDNYSVMHVYVMICYVHFFSIIALSRSMFCSIFYHILSCRSATVWMMETLENTCLFFTAPGRKWWTRIRHVAVIMDGNRRFGRQKYGDSLSGHRNLGLKPVEPGVYVALRCLIRGTFEKVRFWAVCISGIVASAIMEVETTRTHYCTFGI